MKKVSQKLRFDFNKIFWLHGGDKIIGLFYHPDYSFHCVWISPDKKDWKFDFEFLNVDSKKITSLPLITKDESIIIIPE